MHEDVKTQMFLCRVVWGSRGLESFRKEINGLLREGYVIRSMQLTPLWFRTYCAVLLEEPE